MPYKNIVLRLLKDDSGASAIEYGLIIAMISIGLIISLQGVAQVLTSVWNNTSTAMTGSAS